MDFEQFQREYVAARAELESGGIQDVAEVQSQLRELAASLPSAADQRSAHRLIDRLERATALPTESATESATSSPEIAEALRILDTTDFEHGTTEERLAALQSARTRIWAIADRAGPDAPTIRGLTRGLETTENLLTDDLPWDNSPRTGA